MSFDFNFTSDQLAACIPNSNISQWYDPICNILPNYQITSVLRVAAWLAQMGYESNDLIEIEENLNYSAKGLLATFPRYFTPDLANQYQRNPQMIANRVYANRMGNGDESSGDGYNYRGRGLVQITGKENYTSCSNALYGDTSLVDTPDLLCQIDGAISSSCWYWNSRNLNQLADVGDIKSITYRINGGYNGLDERVNRYSKCLQILNS